MDRFVEHIRKRKNIEPEIYSVSKILEYCGMDTYTRLCCDRIEDAGLIDGEHIHIDLDNPRNILVDWRGFAKCEEIIMCYKERQEKEKERQARQRAEQKNEQLNTDNKALSGKLLDFIVAVSL